jgi:hypothetical protein
MPPLIGQKDPDPPVFGPDFPPVSGIFSVPVHTAAMPSCDRARDSVKTAQILVPAGGGRVNWTGPGGTGDFLTTPRPEDRAGISIYHEQQCQGSALSARMRAA